MDQPQAFFDVVAKGDISAVEALLTQQPELTAARNDQGVSAVLTALYNQQRDIADRLLAAAPVLDIFDAAATGQRQRLRTLLDDDATLANAEASDGARPLHLACFFGQTEAAKLLLDCGADVNVGVAAFGGVYPLHSAAASRSVDIVRILLEAGADPNTKQQGGWTALHAAVTHNDCPTTQTLLQHGADPMVKTDDGVTSIDLARSARNLDIVERLKQASKQASA
ncbi:MAG: ankyrin repeat domain-containing protein [Phycisphaerales bacterium]